MARDQVYSQPDAGVGDDRGGGVPDLSGDGRLRGVLDGAGGRRRVVPHGDLALAELRRALGEAGLRGAGLAVLTDEVDVELDGLAHLGGGELRAPLRVEPAAAEGVDHSVERGHDLAPARLAAQADAASLTLALVEPGGELGDLRPRRLRGHLDAGLLEEVLAVHEEGRFAVERYRVHRPLVRQRVAHRRDEVGGVVAGCGVYVGLEVGQPAVLRPLRGLVVRDHDDVELAAARGHRRGDLGAGLVLGEGDEAQPDPGVLRLELRRERDRVLHLRVGHDRDGDGLDALLGAERTRARAAGHQRQTRQQRPEHRRAPPESPSSRRAAHPPPPARRRPLRRGP